ncbi:adenylate kinase [Arthrobacter sp. ISL-28]|uniref:adenylate kinase n=1 Tax=Arthrobacter sp. ISL-28 TaxID=2819108 RepID=UPI001BEC4F9F|nr:adenylate kinase [Arthrobacter sp. ISL-28]MBT2523346.1 adenylate kinase [Arthrobacter sp. ISL-28]
MLVIGPPGSGKGTQAARISERLGVLAISTGEIFRANVKDGTPLGLEARKYIDAGGFVPDGATNNMVHERLSGNDTQNGFLLDGYPRTAAQTDYLDKILDAQGQGLDMVLELAADREELTARLLGRARAAGRTDDTRHVIRRRLGLYHEQTEAVVSEYAKPGILASVDGTGAIEAVTDRLFQAISTRTAAAPRRPSPVYRAAGPSRGM